ncbi:MAG TPA: carbon monoxide dehydrogenase subunit G [Acidocella sp.]|jgi:carbon monoxide dehydrogenase subunit G|nr:carbon monoxide dehydrogenase subunit G [Acidocella sp.]
MELQGQHVIPLPRPQVWAALNDADVLRACIPGCQALTKTAEDRFTATVASKIGPVSAVFTGEVQLLDIVPGLSYTISGSGKGGVAGFAKGRSQVVLADGPEGTVLSYTATAEIGGKLASVGSRLLQGVARRTADDFFTALVNQLAPAPQAVPSAAQPAPEPGASRPAEPAAAPAAYHPAPSAPAPARSSALPWILAAAGWLIAAFLAGHLTR